MAEQNSVLTGQLHVCLGIFLALLGLTNLVLGLGLIFLGSFLDLSLGVLAFCSEATDPL